MNEDLEKQPPKPTEEVDLGQLFNAIGKLFERFFKFIGSIFKGIFSFVVFLLKVVIDNFKLIFAVVIVAFLLGLALEKTKPNVYVSQMLVRPYFDSKFQLINNINYYNTLIGVGDYEKLSNIFKISAESAKELSSFEVKAGPESENEKIKAYGDFLKTIDTSSAKTFTYREFIDNRNIYSGGLFEIIVESTNKDIFRSLEAGLNGAYKNTHSERMKQKRDNLYEIQKANILATLNSIDSLSKVYINVLKQDASKGSTTISFGEGLSLEPESKSKTKEFELLNREIETRNRLARLEELQLEQDTYFDVVTGFQETGSRISKFKHKYSIVFPIIGLLVLTSLFLVLSTIKYVRTYEK